MEKSNAIVSRKDSGNGTGVKPSRYISVAAGSATNIEGEVVDESLVCISVNGRELATMMCSPQDLEELAVGFLYNERLIDNLADIKTVHVSKNDTCIDIWLTDANFQPPEKFIITAGCGGGVTFDDLSHKYLPLATEKKVTAEHLAHLMRNMHLGAHLYHRARGIHTAALADKGTTLLQVEDVGRHNCLDKLAGRALLEEVNTKNKILLSSGRISSEMINKARRLETPIVCSRTSPTALSLALAESWQITIVAYLRQKRMRVYTHPSRIILPQT